MARKKKEQELRPWEDPALRVHPVIIAPQQGLTRQERRHGVSFLPGLPDGMRAAYISAIREAGRNVPFRGKVSDAFNDRSLRLALRRSRRKGLRLAKEES